jgi:hypothetical protein
MQIKTDYLIISNLINKSIKFISEEYEKDHINGIIDIIIEKSNGNDNKDNKNIIIFRIKDNGKGIVLKFFLGYLQSLLPDHSKEQACNYIFAKTLSKPMVERYGLKTTRMERCSFSFSLPFTNDYIDYKD